MTIRIYSTEYTTPLYPEMLDPLLEGLPPDFAAKVRRFRRWQDAYGSIFGRRLLALAMKEQDKPLPSLQYTQFGKPWLPNGPHFNISHSGHRVICAVSEKGRVGIDIEEIKHIQLEDFKDQFSPEEWQIVIAAPDPLVAFYNSWTAKESLIKADGAGLNIPLASLIVTSGKPIFLNHQPWHILSIPQFSGYACHIASELPPNKVLTNEISLNDI